VFLRCCSGKLPTLDGLVQGGALPMALFFVGFSLIDARGQFVRWPARLVARAVLLVAVLTTPLLVWSGSEGISARSAVVTSTADGYRLDAAFDIRLPAGFREAISRGVPVHFLVEFELAKSRWYWFDHRPVKLAKAYTLTYVPLLKQYRLSAGSVSQSFSRLEEALQALSRVRAWPVADRGLVQAGESYQAAVRMRVDTAQLPKPFQLNAVSSQDWNLTSEWYRWSVDP